MFSENNDELTEYFFEAVKKGDLTALKSLFERHKGFDVNSTDYAGNTLLHKALELPDHNTSSLLQFLLMHGADPMAANESGINPIDIVKSPENNNAIALSILKTYQNQRMNNLLDAVNSGINTSNT